MNQRKYIGIDISKLNFDAFIYGINQHKVFSNDKQGFDSLLRWLKKTCKSDDINDFYICLEHTGIYSLTISVYFEENNVVFSMISPLEIKRSLGITRGKNDKVDARRIAEYAYLKREHIKSTKLPSKSILKLHPLLTLRDRLSRDKGQFEGTLKEQTRFMSTEEIPELVSVFKNVIASLSQEIKKIEEAIRKTIQGDPELLKTFNLITSIKGVGLLVGAYLIVYTHNFTRFNCWRKFACYAGIAPFEHQSGISIRGKTKVSQLGNKQIKRLLTLSALNAAHTDEELSVYYQKRLKEGKNKMSTLNIIRNKIVSRVFAVVNRGTPYVDVMKFAS